jgi:hypothetical protein
MLQNNSYFGSFDTSTFSEVYPDVEAWKADFAVFGPSLDFYGDFKEADTISKCYYMLASEYAFSHHIGGRDQFKLMLWTKVMEYLPILEKELALQKEVLAMDSEALREGSKAIYNTALNPGNAPTTDSLETLEYINQQNTTNYKKSKPEAYLRFKEAINKNLIKEFIGKFKNLFIRVCYPDNPLWYVNDPTLTMIEGE